MIMEKLKRGLFRAVVWILISIAICELWEFIEIAMYGESQSSIVDAIMSLFMTDWIHSKIWRG